jgi:UDP:flavonoid glycosyltransferase YjiC (YdhE family)
VDVLITIGPGNSFDSIGSLPASMHVETYVPQSLVLPRCSAVICHGGAGTTLAALASGLPLLILPQGADQYVIGDLVVGANVGNRLVPSEVSPAAIRSSVVALLNGSTYTANAQRLRCEISGMPGPDEAVEQIEDLVRSNSAAERSR